MSALFVVPCRFDPERPVIFECIESIQRHHDNPKILVIDSGSPDKSYLMWCLEHRCKVADINNQLYATGAHAWAFRHYPDIDYFYMMFDSLLVQSNLDHLQDVPLTTVRHWHSTQHDWGWDHDGTHLSVWGGEQLDRMGVPRTTDYFGIMGPMMFIQRQVAEQLDSVGYWFAQVTSSYLHCAMERVAGITLAHLGWDPTQSLQGVHTSHTADYPEEYIRKVDMGRA